MKKRLLTLFIALTVLASGCDIKDDEQEQRDINIRTKPTETEPSVVEPSLEPTTIKAPEPQEDLVSVSFLEDGTPVFSHLQYIVANWDDVNLNFAHDMEDFYYLDSYVVTMQTWYQQMEARTAISYTADYALLYYPRTFTEFIYEDPNGFLGTKEMEMSDSNGLTIVITYPYFTVDTPDAAKINEEIDEFISEHDPLCGDSNIGFRVFENKGLYTYVIYYGDSFSEARFFPVTLNSKGEIVDDETILKASGWTSDEYDTAGLERLKEAYRGASEIAYYMNGDVLDYQMLEDSFKEKKIFLNGEGELTVLLKSSIPSEGVTFDICFPLEKAIDESCVIPTTAYTFNRSLDLFEAAEMFELDYRIDKGTPVTIDQIDLTDASMGDSFGIEHGVINITYDPDNNQVRVVTCDPHTEIMRYEVYKDGDLCSEGEASVCSGEGREYVFSPDGIEDVGVYCIVIFDPADTDKVIAEYHVKAG